MSYITTIKFFVEKIIGVKMRIDIRDKNCEDYKKDCNGCDGCSCEQCGSYLCNCEPEVIDGEYDFLQ